MPADSKTLTPIFLFSLPRSGSTLIQRILALHPDISTIAEPWLLLPYLYTLKECGIYAEYAHFGVTRAIADLCQVLPNGQSDYLAEIRELALRLYAKASEPNAKYFVDKTPRYHLIVKEVIDLFPEGKFVFLWRNPLAIVASIMETWGQGQLNIYRFKVDLFTGLANLCTAYQTQASDFGVVQYEDLLVNPETTCLQLFNYLGLSFDPAWLKNLANVRMKGRLGDAVGTNKYRTMSSEPLEKWRFTLSNPVRKAWCQNYLRWIGAQRLSLMGYNLDLLLNELNTVPVNLKGVGSDIFHLINGVVKCAVEPHIIKHKVQNADSWRDVHLHL